MTTVQGCILFGERVVIPEIHRKQLLKRLHHGHPGMVRMKCLARSVVYWPGIDQQIEDYVEHCKECAVISKCPSHAPSEAWPKPAGPWQRIHVYYAGPIDRLYFLLITDAFLKWPEIFPTKVSTSKATIDFLHTTFARFGLPGTIVSDNGPQFASGEFELFCNNGIIHIRTAPYHPQSNGHSGRFVDTMKRAMKKINKGKPL